MEKMFHYTVFGISNPKHRNIGLSMTWHPRTPHKCPFTVEVGSRVDGDHANAVLSAVGYNLRLVLKWLRHLLHKILVAILAARRPDTVLIRLLNGQLIRDSALKYFCADPPPQPTNY